MSTATTASPWPLTLAGTALIASCYGLARFAYGLFAPAFRQEFGFDAATLGAIAAAAYVSYCLGIAAATLLSPRLGARPVAIGAGVTATIGMSLIAASPGPAMLAVGVFIAGASTGIASPPLAQAVARGVAEPRRDRAQTLINAGTGIGVAIAGPVALLAQDSWRSAWIGFAVIGVLVTVAIAHAVPGEPHGTADSQPRSGLGRLPRAALLRLALCAGLVGVASTAVWTFGIDALSSRGTDPTTISLAWIALGAAGVIGGAAGDLAGRLGAARAWSICLALLAAGTLAWGFGGTSPVALGLAAAAAGAGYIAMTGLVLLAGTRILPEQTGLGVGIGFLALALGQAAGSPLLGWIIDGFGAGSAFIAATVLAALTALLPPMPALPGHRSESAPSARRAAGHRSESAPSARRETGQRRGGE